ncbi:MAG: phospho-N-acetylmuramoyl-pentapeptide-transferase [Chloroflexi bacterium]|nr:phospho-N-acetylmuramoyl-pentapeptide-transferase [Chloroflexota bacterium]
MAQALLWGTVSFLLSVLSGRPLIGWLKRHGIGKTIRIDGPSTHQVKMGTPTMGGLMILLPVVVVTLLTNLKGRYSILMPLGVMAGYGLLGAYDDWRGLRDRSGVGFLARFKFPWQVLIGILAAIGLQSFLRLGGMAVPTVPTALDIGWLYVPIAAFLIVGAANAVNLADGLDGLAGGTVAIAFIAYGVIAYLQGQAYLVTFCFTVVGAVFGFLWYNAYPAELFMGDVGALALGATLATVALMTEQWLLLAVVGIVFVAEVLSVALQVGYFKITRGKRLFKMAPLHHHLELLGWSEVQIVQRFWLIAMLAAMVGIALALW